VAVGGSAPGSLSGTLGGGTSITGVGPIVLGELDGPTLVKVTISGLMDLFIIQ
jgi:hypothetical protein